MRNFGFLKGFGDFAPNFLIWRHFTINGLDCNHSLIFVIDLFLSNVKFPILVIGEHWKFNVHISREGQ
jgi:hypothetical protein